MRHITRLELGTIINNILGERLPNVGPQGIYAESATPKYKVGARLPVPGGWVLHYCQAMKTLGTFHYMRLAGSGNVMDAGNEFLALAVAAPAGQNRITIVDATSPLNYYENGLAECWHGGACQQHRVKSSTATVGGVVVLTLYDNLLTALDTIPGDSVSLSPSPYRNVAVMGGTGDLAGHAGFVTAVGLPLFDITDNYYAWIVTWGPVSISMQGGNGPDEAAVRKDVFCHTDGTCADAQFASFLNQSAQRVGYGLPAGAYGHSQIMLQLDP